MSSQFINDGYIFVSIIFILKISYQNILVNDKINDKINKVDELLNSEIRRNKYITIPELSIIVKKFEPTIHRHLDSLVSKGLIKRVGSRKTGYWEILK